MGTKEGSWGVQRGVQRVLERYSKGAGESGESGE